MILYTSTGAQITTGKPKGSGGEAAIFAVHGQDNVLAKIYGKPNTNHERKLKAMVANPPDDPSKNIGHASISWPIDLLYDGRTRQFAGYLMPFVKNAVMLIQVINPMMRKKVLPGFDWKYLHRSARNLAAAVGALHARGYVIGDLNESNVLVNPMALVTVIDCDSMQVKIGSQVLPCPVGKPDYTPPELQGVPFARVQRLPEHDAFALGILVYQLLLNGNHPYRSQWLGRGDPLPIEQRIKNGWFPYSRQACPKEIALPPRAPLLGWLYPKVSVLARRCFIEGYKNPKQRPSPREWEAALAEAEKAIVPCFKGHQYSRHLPQCPRCQRP